MRGQPRIRAFAAPLPHTLAALRRVPASRLMTPPVRRALNSPSGLESTTSRRLNHACRQPQVQGIGLARMFLLPTLSRTFVATPSRTHRSVHGVLWTDGTALLGVSCIFFAFSHLYFASSPYGTPLYFPRFWEARLRKTFRSGADHHKPKTTTSLPANRPI